MTYIKPDKCPKCGGSIWAVEYSLLDPEHYDGTSEWACEHSINEVNPHTGVKRPHTCDYRIGRFCGKRLDAKEIEPRYCQGKAHPVHA